VWGIWHVWGGEVYTGFGRQLKEKDCMENLSKNGRIILK
jgi:hypothetical protein